MQTQHTDIVIIGAGLTGLTAAFHLINEGKKVLLLEKNHWVGGQIRTFEEDGFVFESGPNTGSVSHPEVTELLNALSPACELEIADENANNRLIWKGDRFRKLPSGLIGGITTPLFTLSDKFRILGEPFRKKGTNPDESVGELANRRLGKSFVNYAVDPFLSGIYAGDPMKLITRYALPKLYNLEQNYGSFIGGSIAKAKEPKTERDRLATKKVFSTRGGLSSLTNALGDAIGKENIRLSVSDILVHPFENQWKVTFSTLQEEETILASKVITTVGAYALPNLLPFIAKEEMDKISNLQYAPVVEIAVGIKDTRGLQFNAFGGLVPSIEKKDVLGILFPSACFQGRAPESGTLFTFYVGGIKKHYLTQLSDNELKELVCKELHAMLKLPASMEPDMIRIFRHTHAIPQYELSTGERLATIECLQKRYPGLIIAGNLRNGISMADRILQGATISYEI
ncbi:protoporphyrinogen oxidase [Bacteroidia bacterium]|nr:protoporphyrinogen oxidase [Bacteroidia bacterium]